MKVGFTGTLNGMTDKQLIQVHMLVGDMQTAGFSQANHGMAVGADEQFHFQVKGFGYFVVGVPGVTREGKIWKRSEKCECDLTMPPKYFLIRNHVIVNESDVMIATPSQTQEEQRSGTWATIRYARTMGVPLVILWPDGSSTVERVPGVTTAEEYRHQLLREKTG